MEFPGSERSKQMAETVKEAVKKAGVLVATALAVSLTALALALAALVMAGRRPAVG